MRWSSLRRRGIRWGLDSRRMEYTICVMKASAKKLASPHAERKKPARKRKLDASGLAWLLDRELPPVDQLPENPVLVLRRL